MWCVVWATFWGIRGVLPATTAASIVAKGSQVDVCMLSFRALFLWSPLKLKTYCNMWDSGTGRLFLALEIKSKNSYVAKETQVVTIAGFHISDIFLINQSMQVNILFS